MQEQKQEYHYVIYKEIDYTYSDYVFYENIVIEIGSKNFIDFVIEQNEKKETVFEYEIIHQGSFETQVYIDPKNFIENLRVNIFYEMKSELKVDVAKNELWLEEQEYNQNQIIIHLLELTENQKKYLYDHIMKTQLVKLAKNFSEMNLGDLNDSLLSQSSQNTQI